MKRTLPFLLILCLLLLSAGCAGGNVSNVQRKIDESALYTQEEIEDAMAAAIAHFDQEFEGCTLLEIEYSEEHSEKFASEWAEQYGEEEAIVLLSMFEVDENGGDGSFNPDSTYTGWQWILTRSAGENWTLRTWGYG